MEAEAQMMLNFLSFSHHSTPRVERMNFLIHGYAFGSALEGRLKVGQGKSTLTRLRNGWLRFKPNTVTPKPVLLISDLYCGVASDYLRGVVKFSRTSPRSELYVYI